jgi:hypothetical protein
MIISTVINVTIETAKVLNLSHPSELDYDSELIRLTNTTSKLKLKAVPRSLTEETHKTAFLRHSVTTPSSFPMLSHDSNIVGDIGDFKRVDKCESVIVSKILETPVQSSSKANLGSCGNAASSVLTSVSLHDFLSKSDPYTHDTFQTITDDSHERIEIEYVKAQSSPRSSDHSVQSCTYFENRRPEGTQLMVSLLPEKAHQAIGESIPSISMHGAYSPSNEMSKTCVLDSETFEDFNPNANLEKIFDGKGMTFSASPELDSKIVTSQKCPQLPTLQPLNEGNLTLSIYPSCTDSESNLSAHEESIELVDDATRILEIRRTNGAERVMTLHHEISPPIPSKRLKTSKNPDSDKENDKCKASEAFHVLKDYKALAAKNEHALPLPIRKNSKELVDSDASDSCTCEENKVSEKSVSEIPEVTIQNEVEGKPKNSYHPYGIEGKKKKSSMAYFETEKVMIEGSNERKPFNASTRNRAEMWSKRVKSLRTMDNEHLVDLNKCDKSSNLGANESQGLSSKLIALAKKYKGTQPSDEARDQERKHNIRISKVDTSEDLGEKSNRSNNSMANFMVRKSVIPADTPPRISRRRKRVAQKHLNSTLKSEAMTKDPIEKQISITAKASLRSTATDDDQYIKQNGRNEERNEEKEISESNLKMKPTTSNYVECSRTESLMNPQPGTFQIKASTKSNKEYIKQHETQNVSAIGSTRRYQHNNEATQNSISGEAGISKTRQFEKMQLLLSSTSTKESNRGQIYHREEEYVREHGNYKLDPSHLEKQRLELSEKTDESKEREIRDLDTLDKGVKEVLSIEDRMKRTECAPKRTDNRRYRLGKNLVKKSFNRKRTTDSEFKGLSSENDVGHTLSSTELSKGGQNNISANKESEASLCSRNNNTQNQMMCQSQGIHALYKFESSTSCEGVTEALVSHHLCDVTKERAARSIPTDLGIDTGLYNMRQSDCQEDKWGEKMMESENSRYIPDTLSPRNSILVTLRRVAINLGEETSFHGSPAMLNDTQSNVSASSGASNLTERAFRALNLRRNVAGQELEIVKKSNDDVPSPYIITKHQSSDLNQTAKEGFKYELTTRTPDKKSNLSSFGRSTLANRYTLTDRFLPLSYSASEVTEGHEMNEEKKKVQNLSNRTESNLSSMIAASTDTDSENFSNDQANITISRNSSADVFGIDANFPNQSAINLSAMKSAYDKVTATELAKDLEQEIKLTLGGSVDAVKSLAKEIEKLTKTNQQNEFDDQPPQVFCENSTDYVDGDEDIAIEVEYIEDDNNKEETLF